MAVGIETSERLQNRRHHLKKQRDDAYLREREAVAVFYYRVD